MPFGLQKVQKTVGTSQQQQRSSKNPFCILIFQLAADLFFHYLVGMQVIFFYTSKLAEVSAGVKGAVSSL